MGIEDNEPERLSAILLKIQEFGIDRFADRLVLGFLYFNEIFKYIDTQIFRKRKLYFAEFYPANLIKIKDEDLEYNVKYHLAAFRTEDEYHNALLDGELQLGLFLDREEYFVPNYISYIRQPLVVLEEEQGSAETNRSQTGPAKRLRYKFTTRSYSFDEVKKGDWILEYAEEKPVALYRIRQADRQWLDLEHFRSKSKETTEADKDTAPPRRSYIYYKKIDRLEYYLHILGMYIHQLFYYGDSASNTDVLAFVEQVHIDMYRNPNKGYRVLPVQDLVQKLYPRNTSSAQGWEKEIFELLAALTRLYAQLSFHQAEGGFYEDLSGETDPEKQDQAIRRIFSKLKSEILSIREKIERLLGMTEFTLDNMGLPLPEEIANTRVISKNTREGMAESFPKEFNFVKVLELAIESFAKPESTKTIHVFPRPARTNQEDSPLSDTTNPEQPEQL